MAQKVQAAVAVVGEVVEEVLEVVEPFQDWIDPYQDRLYNAVKDTAFIQAIQQDARERPLEGILAAVVLDFVYDVASFALGHDLFSGEKLSHGEELFTAVAIAIPVVSIAAVKHGGRLLQGGKQVATHVDEFSDGVKFAARHADELKDGTRVAAKHGDELLERAAWTARHGDNLAESQTLTRRLDDWVSPDGQMARLGDDALQRQRLSRQVDGDVSHSLTNKPSDPNFQASQQVLSQDEIYDKLAETPTGRLLFDQIDEIGERPLIRYSNENMKPYAAATYFPMENEIRIKPELQDLPEEAILATVAHELAHRTHRPLAGSINSEVFAHFIEAQVWRELEGAKVIQNFNQSGLSTFQKQLLADQLTISNIRTVQEMENFVRPRYSTLPNYSAPHAAYIGEYQKDIDEIYRQRELYGAPMMYEHTLQKYKEFIEFWGNFKE